jgi:hypothetical protein
MKKTRHPLIRVWTKKTTGIYEEAKAQYAQGHWSGWPENSNQDLVCFAQSHILTTHTLFVI